VKDLNSHKQPSLVAIRVECCPLCGGTEIGFYHRDVVRQYHRCTTCKLVFVPEQFHVTLEREKSEYDLHENNCRDEGYLRFLSRFSKPFVQQLDAGKRGLDFGCGPAPALATLIEQHGYVVTLYDPMYKDDKSVLEKEYDFICATEVVEHFRDPGAEFAKIFTMLLPGGWLGMMTKMVRDEAAFKTWHYIRDPTHISFYSQETFIYLGRKYGATVHFVEDDVIFMEKSG
jgi:SAM-dependent methyltransferase